MLVVTSPWQPHGAICSQFPSCSMCVCWVMKEVTHPLIHRCTQIRTHMCTHAQDHTHVNTETTHVYGSTYISTCMHRCTHMWTHMTTHIHTDIYMCKHRGPHRITHVQTCESAHPKCVHTHRDTQTESGGRRKGPGMDEPGQLIAGCAASRRLYSCDGPSPPLLACLRRKPTPTGESFAMKIERLQTG